MPESKHTTGPWEATKVDRYLGGDYIITGNMQRSNGETDVAAVFGGKVEGRTAANARLIAAAPDLYEALRGLLDAGVLNPTGSERVARAIQQARDALFAVQTKRPPQDTQP